MRLIDGRMPFVSTLVVQVEANVASSLDIVEVDGADNDHRGDDGKISIGNNLHLHVKLFCLTLRCVITSFELNYALESSLNNSMKPLVRREF